MSITLTLCFLAYLAPPEGYGWQQTLDAIRQVETGGEPDGGIGAVGDNGNALGPYQIWKPYWQDANMGHGTHERCLTDKPYSEWVVRGYMHRYARASLLRLEAGQGALRDVEIVARTHNGGPRGPSKESTLAYWRKVKGNL